MSNKNGNVHVINRETGSIIRYKCSADKNLCDLRLKILAHLLFIKAHRAVGLFGNDYDLSLPSIKRLKFGKAKNNLNSPEWSNSM